MRVTFVIGLWQEAANNARCATKTHEKFVRNAARQLVRDSSWFMQENHIKYK